MGGGTFIKFHQYNSFSGLSPRGRGNQVEVRVQHEDRHGSIPAWAGEPSSNSGQYNSFSGLSPRGRGNLHLGFFKCLEEGSIPAWAGEPGASSLAYNYDWGLSPRGRGNRRTPGGHNTLSGSIPAWAGEPGMVSRRSHRLSVYPRVGGGTYLKSSGRQSQMPVYPRVGGGTASINGLSHPTQGLSPRGRGNHQRGAELCSVRRSIPAWAGEPPLADVGLAGDTVYPRVGGGTLDRSSNL